MIEDLMKKQEDRRAKKAEKMKLKKTQYQQPIWTTYT